MAQEPNEIRDHINASRARLEDDLHEIEDRVKDAMDWRSWYKKNTVAMLGAAVAGGFILSMAIGRSSRNGSVSTRSETEFTPETEWRREERTGPSIRSEIGSKVGHHLSRLGDIVDNSVGALLGAASHRLQDYVSQTIPGFKEYYTEAERMKRRM